MSDKEILVNRVEKSGLIVLDLVDLLPDDPVELFDIKDFLVNELVLMEKPFREVLSNFNWDQFENKLVGVYCSNDALIPMWAYMLISSYLKPVAKKIFYGDLESVHGSLLNEAIENLDLDKYKNEKVIIKGCGGKAIPPSAFIEITNKLKPVTQSLMYGEPCSTVPVYKRPN